MPDFIALSKDLQVALDAVVRAKSALAQAAAAADKAASDHSQALQRAQDVHAKFIAEVAEILPLSTPKHLKL